MLERMRNSWPAAVLFAAAACAGSAGSVRESNETPKVPDTQSAPAPALSPTPALPAIWVTRTDAFKVLPLDGTTSCDDVEGGLQTVAVQEGATPVSSRDVTRSHPGSYFFPSGVRIDTARRALTLDERGVDGADAVVQLRFGTTDAVGKTTWDDSLTLAVPCTERGGS